MVQLEAIRVGARIHGLHPTVEAEIASVRWIGTDALEVIFRAGGDVGHRIVYRSEESSLLLAGAGRAFSFTADGATLRLASEALRIRLAHLFDPYLAVHASRIEALPHQITAVYGEMLTRQPLRFLLADDPGAGKTVMAGLLAKELLIRGDLDRCLIVAPGSLVEQWQEELDEKFGLRFDILTRDQIENSATGNPFVERSRLILRLDMAARSEELRAKLSAAPDWDLVIVDEAHRMAASYFGGEVKETQRHRLGKLLGTRTRNLLLMTATPHNGKEADFQLFMSLLDGDRFEGRFREGVHKADVADMMRRLTKEELYRFDGTRLFPERRAYTAAYDLTPDEVALYAGVTHYVREEMNRADRLAAATGDDKRRVNIGFALQILQRRLASSPAAIHRSLQRRRERLEARLREETLVRGAPTTQRTVEPDYDPEEMDDASADEVEAIEEQVLDRATAAISIAELEAEIVSLRTLEEQALRLKNSGHDAKWRELLSILDHPLVREQGVTGGRKLIIFTEPKDTLEHLAEKIRQHLGRADAVRVIHGGVAREARRASIAAFNDDPEVRILIANDAAGEGVNLQRGAHLMVNYDLPWNPNRIEQRFGRIHRIGQTEVCHLWNLCARNTREGEVYRRLLDKIEEARAALGGRVYDVMGELFEGQALAKLLVDAVRYGERPDIKAKLFEKVDAVVDVVAITNLVRERKLTSEGIDPRIVETVRAEMERAEARRLQPRYIRSFFETAFERLGGRMVRREHGRFEITRVPAKLRDRDRVIGRSDPVLERYARITFDKAFIAGTPQAVLMSPGHPLLDAVVDLSLEQFAGVLKDGAILVDEADDGDELRVLYYLEHAVRDGRQSRSGEPRVVSQRLQFVLLDQAERPRDGGWAPYLDYRPITDDERRTIEGRLAEPWLSNDLENRARDFAVTHLVREHVEEVRARRVREIDKIEREVKVRLEKEIAYWDARAARLLEEERAGVEQRLNARNAQTTAQMLVDRLERRLGELNRERDIAALPPVVRGGALVVPIGLLRATDQAGKGVGENSDPESRAEIERLAMVQVMSAEAQLGREAKDGSAAKCGYDIESRCPATGRLYFIEVKGRVSGAETVTLTRNEVLTALNSPDNYILAIVEIDGGFARRPVYVRNFATREPGFAEISVNLATKDLFAVGTAPA